MVTSARITEESEKLSEQEKRDLLWLLVAFKNNYHRADMIYALSVMNNFDGLNTLYDRLNS